MEANVLSGEIIVSPDPPVVRPKSTSLRATAGDRRPEVAPSVKVTPDKIELEIQLHQHTKIPGICLGGAF